jgi:hypothetical protein
MAQEARGNTAIDGALAVCPDAEVEIGEEGDMLLPSRPPIPERQLLRE